MTRRNFFKNLIGVAAAMSVIPIIANELPKHIYTIHCNMQFYDMASGKITTQETGKIELELTEEQYSTFVRMYEYKSNG